MKKILILVAAVLMGVASCADSKQAMTVTVTNPLALERTGEMVEVPMSDVVAKLKLADTAQIVVLDADRKSTRLNSSHNNQSRMPSSA